MIRVYLGAPTEQQPRARQIAAALVQHTPDVFVVSTWHDTPKAKYPADARERSDALALNLSQLDRADVALFLLDIGRPRTTLCELGYAVARGCHVVMTGPHYSFQKSLFDAHGRVRVVPVHGLEQATLVARVRGAIEAAMSQIPALRREYDKEAEALAAEGIEVS
jgi:nucleoside 2-deoxyribosyltransferase